MVRPMQTTPLLTDRTALLQKRARADLDDGMFLQTTAREEIQDRLSLVNRAFTKPAIITPFPTVWADFPNATIRSDDDLLDLGEGQHDLVIHATSLHWANDPVGQMIQARRALKPDGLFMGAMFGGETLQELRIALGQAEADMTGGLSPRVAPMGEIRDLGGLLQRSGLALPVADSVSLTVSYETPLHLMRDLRKMGETNALHARLRRSTRRSVIERACEIYTREFAEDTGRVRATFEIIFLTGWSPDPSQQQPLRPGSATNRLADALATDEFKLT